jgi:phosphoenolpyruvate carboxylase
MQINNLAYNQTKYQTFQREVVFRFQLFSSLFLSLPFKGVNEAGSLLTKFSSFCIENLNKEDNNPIIIVEKFFKLHKIKDKNMHIILFQFLQFIERQIVLFDSLEDASFSQINNLSDSGSVDAFFSQIVNSESKLDLLNEILSYYKIRVVLTAHPTQFYPDQVLGIIADLSDAFQKRNLDEIKSTFLQLGLTKFTNKKKPTPIDEALSLLWYLKNVFYHQIFAIQNKLPGNNINLELGFWPGGDRDGNPYVVAATTLAVAKKLKSTILRLYFVDLKQLKNKLTFDGVYEKIINISYKVVKEQYINSNELLDDLKEIKIILLHKYQGLFVNLVDEMILKIKLFNFYFVKLDVRQNSSMHKKVIQHIFSVHKICNNYELLNDNEKLKLLKANLNNNKIIDYNYTDELTNEVIETFKVIQQIQVQNGKEAIERYIISNTSSVINIFEVLFFIQNINNYLIKVVKEPKEKCLSLGIVPLFETIPDLEQSVKIMQQLYSDNEYIKLLKQQNNKQTIMVGFSDGTKDGGYFMANWAIYKTKEELTKLSKKYNIEVVFFDGRGGPPSRGGGNTNNFYRSLGKKIAAREIQLTVQGQTISSNFGNLDAAGYNLEQLFTSGLFNKFMQDDKNTLSVAQEKLFALLADESYKVYLDLRNDPLFVPYLEEITPLKYIADINIGSRPVKRNKDAKLRLEDLRAIPFVGAWTQMKQNILGYYGLGSALANVIAKNSKLKKELKILYNDSLFFKSLVNNSLQSLFKSNFKITQYLQHDKKFGKFWQKIKKETELSKKMLLEITGYEDLLSMDVVVQESIKLREEIIIPLLIIQQYSLAKIRNGCDDNEKHSLERLIKKSLAANINASRNSV